MPGRWNSGPDSKLGAGGGIAALALLCLLAACGGPAPEDVSRTALGADGGPGGERGRAPERIVSLAPAITEVLFALGLGERVVGVTSFCDWPPEARTKPRVGGYVNPSVEAILALAPDLVLVSPNTGNRDAALAVRRAGARLVVVPGERIEGTLAAIREVARVCGVEERGQALARELRRRIDAAAARVADLEPVRALFCLEIDPIIAAGTGTLPAEVLALAGGRNVLDAQGYPRLGLESVIERAPSVILQARMDTDDPGAERRVIEFWERWPAIPAVRDHRLHVVDGATALRPGPRIAEAVEGLAALLHPEKAERESAARGATARRPAEDGGAP